MDETCNIQEERYRVFIEDVADGFYETDLQGFFLFFNDALCRIFGYPRKDIQNRNYREFMDEKTAESAWDDFNHIYKTGKKGKEIVWEIIRKDGQKRILEISAKLIRNENGQRTGFQGIARDMTEKYQAQEALKVSEKALMEQFRENRRARRRFQALLEFLPDPVFVFNMDGTVAYLNPAFQGVFGWSLEEVKNKHIPFVPDDLKEETRQGFQQLFLDRMVSGLESKRLTKDGRLLDIILDAAIFYEKGEEAPAGQVIRLRDVTRQKQIEKTNSALFRIANALPHYRKLDDLLRYITREVRDLLSVEGASVILMDEEKQEFFFRVTVYDDAEAGRRIKEIRFPADKGVAGEVYRTRKPLIVPDTEKSPHFHHQVDEESGYTTRNMLDVPVWFQDRLIGVLCGVNKKGGAFSREDVELLSTIATTVALPIENTRINEELRESYKNVKALNRAKDRVIHHLSHELKTPVSVLAASLNILKKKLKSDSDPAINRVLERAGRNLERILDMQYRIEDILSQKDFRTYHLISRLLDVCMDELESLATEAFGDDHAVRLIRENIETIFGPRQTVSESVFLHEFAENHINTLRSDFAHRRCRLETRLVSVPPVLIPREVLKKIITGLVRNAVENTPDQSRIEVGVETGNRGTQFIVKDYGVGITSENRPRLFENIFTTRVLDQYASRKPFDFYAGGKGFDLLRMKIFSERYRFTIEMNSVRCSFIPRDSDFCPGLIDSCVHCQTIDDCLNSGGTEVILTFTPDETGVENNEKMDKEDDYNG